MPPTRGGKSLVTRRVFKRVLPCGEPADDTRPVGEGALARGGGMMQPVDEPLATPWRPVEAIPVGLAALSASYLVWVALTAVGGGSETDLQIAGLVQQALFLGLSVAWV